MKKLAMLAAVALLCSVATTSTARALPAEQACQDIGGTAVCILETSGGDNTVFALIDDGNGNVVLVRQFGTSDDNTLVAFLRNTDLDLVLLAFYAANSDANIVQAGFAVPNSGDVNGVAVTLDNNQATNTCTVVIVGAVAGDVMPLDPIDCKGLPLLPPLPYLPLP